MKTLLLMRHAKSSWKEPGQPDRERGLNDRGKRDAPRMGRLLVDERLVPDLIIASSATRARRTAEKVAEACGYADQVRLRDELYEALPEAYLRVLVTVPPECGRVLVVGHNPGLEMLLNRLTGAEEELPTAALCVVAFDATTWDGLGGDGEGRLERIWRPRELGADDEADDTK